MVAVKAPGFGDNRKNQLRDMAIATGGTVSPLLISGDSQKISYYLNEDLKFGIICNMGMIMG